MKEKPIIFSGEMIQAILEGRKTQTRRSIKPQPDYVTMGCPQKDGADIKFPYGHVGDRLWVREKWRRPHCNEGSPLKLGQSIQYHASSPWFDGFGESWRSPIHMPRWASRITLDITEVRVERLHDLSEGDAIAEGIAIATEGTITQEFGTAIRLYQKLWDSLNAKRCYPWESNPWVWTISFRVLNER